MEPKRSPESVVREIKRKTRRKFSSEEKIRIVLEGLKGEESISEICRREGITPNLYLKGDTVREATSVEVTTLRQENEQLKQLVAELSLKERVLKKSLNGEG
jgi:transposase